MDATQTSAKWCQIEERRHKKTSLLESMMLTVRLVRILKIAVRASAMLHPIHCFKKVRFFHVSFDNSSPFHVVDERSFLRAKSKNHTFSSFCYFDEWHSFWAVHYSSNLVCFSDENQISVFVLEELPRFETLIQNRPYTESLSAKGEVFYNCLLLLLSFKLIVWLPNIVLTLKNSIF